MRIEIDTDRNLIIVADRMISLDLLATLVEPDPNKLYQFKKGSHQEIIVTEFRNITGEPKL